MRKFRVMAVTAFTAAFTALTLSTAAYAQPDERTEQVQFTSGASSKAVKGKIKGYATTSYIVRANKGQTLTVSLKTSNPSGYFNVMAPAVEEALFVGSTSGNEFQTVLPSTGEYKIQVYLMRNAARRSEVANYTLNIGVK